MPLMPPEKRPGKHVFWWTCGRTLSHCGFLVAYLVNGILLVAAGSLLFTLFSSSVPVPRFVIMALEANLAAEGLGQKIETIEFDFGGRTLLKGIQLFSSSYEEPLALIDQALVRIDVHLPTTDGRELMLSRYTQPDRDQKLLLEHLKLKLPPHPSPKIATAPNPSL